MNHETRITEQLLGRAPAGGTILGIAAAGSGQLWAASPAGLFHYRDGQWHPVTTLPAADAGTVAARGQLVLSAGLTRGASYSVDAGKTWYPCIMEQVSAPISCFAISPNFSHDATVLAATQGDGILRSRDGGRMWQLANFGLRSFTVITLASAPAWGRREPVYAGTLDGVYYSPNAGRAWKFCGLAGQAVLALALSPDYLQDQTLYAGLETGDLYRSVDAGCSWQALDLGIEDAAVNGLACLPDNVVLAATGEHGLLRSADGGQTWAVVAGLPEDIMCMEVDGLGEPARVLCGAYEGGLWRSLDGGASWEIDDGLVARRFQWLAAAPVESFPAQSWIAGGFEAGIWLAKDDGASWCLLEDWPEGEKPLCLAAGKDSLWAGATAGLWQLRDPGMAFEQALDTAGPVTAVTTLVVGSGAPGGEIVFAAGNRLWYYTGDETGWHDLAFPFRDKTIMALQVVPEAPGRLVLMASVYGDTQQEVQLWQLKASVENPAEGCWEAWLSERTPWRRAYTAYGAGQWVAGLGTSIVYRAGDQWRWVEITNPGAPIQALLWVDATMGWLAAAGEDWLASNDLEHWRKLDRDQRLVDGQPGKPGAVIPEGDGQWVGLSSDGKLFRLKLY